MLEAAATAPNAPTTRPKVLIVDDELGPRESISYLLQDEFEVHTADRVDRGLELASRESFAVVIMDIRMPQKNGIQGLEELRRIDPDVSVIMLTGYGALASAQVAMSLGANEYLKKPFDVEVMLQAVHRHAQATLERKKRSGLFRHLEDMYESVKREQKKSQVQLGYGQAAAEMVHDICNPLVVAIGYSNMLLDEARQLPPGPPAIDRIVKYAETLEKCSSFCLHLAESWRQSTKHAREPETFDLLATARETRTVLFFDTPRIEVCGAGEAKISGVRFDIVRVLQNLLKNALEAGASQVVVTVVSKDGRTTLSVADNGTGFPPEILKTIMKRPVESTKAHGTGLGLTICRHIALAHSAEMTVDARPGGGTVFKLVFPPVAS
jgi:signal transduction histidine kinase